MAKERDEGLTVITPVGIACFAHVWEPHSFPNKGGPARDPQYRLTLVFDKSADLSEMKKAAGRAAVKKWGKDDAKRMLNSGQLRMPWRPASDYLEYGEPFTNPGATFISSSSNGAPEVVDARAKPIMTQQDFYSGCKARISVYAHAYDTLGNKGVTFLLNNVQKVSDGTRLSGRRAAEEEFDAVDSGSDDDDII